MSIHGYVGNIITANPTAPTSTVASGVWTTEQQLIAVAAGNWPFTIPPQQISRSLRFNSEDSAYLSRTFGTPTDNLKWTMSMWVKRGVINSPRALFSAPFSGSSNFSIGFSASGSSASGDFINYHIPNVGSRPFVTSAVYRDTSAWYHFVFVFDSANATQADRFIIYVNGVRQAASTASVSLNQACAFNQSGVEGVIGKGSTGYGTASDYADGYLTEINFIDGQALTPSSFGRTSTTTGVWEPLAYTGTYGTNGFYLNFSDNSNTTAATLGKDYSGNGNNWTPNNFSVTAGAGNDSLVDSPTAYGTDTGVGGEVRGNYCTWNPLDSSGNTLANGNLQVTEAGSSYNQTLATQAIDYKTYAEFTLATLSGQIGVQSGARNDTGSGGFSMMTIGYNTVTTGSYAAGEVNTAGSASGTTYTAPSTNDVFMIAVDPSNGKVWMGLQGTWFNSGNPAAGTGEVGTISTSSILRFVFGRNAASGGVVYANFGQRAFAYTAPSGFKALVTTNLPTPTIGATSTTLAGNYFNANLWTGTGASNAITGVGFSPDFVWIKKRSGADNHNLYDTNRGANKRLISNSTNAENTETQALMSFDSNGFTLGTDGGVNQSGQTYVGWSWRGSDSSAVTNTAGTITSTVSASTTSGFSIATFTTPSSFTNATVGHGLGVAPSMIIVRRLTTSDWITWHTSIGTNGYLTLNTTNQSGSDSGAFNGTSSTTWTMGSNSWWQAAAANWICYSFAAVAGYSAFGSYTGNGSTDGPFVYTGFRPEFILRKNASDTWDWHITDSSRNTYNAATSLLFPNLSNAEATNNVYAIDIVSNGFKIRSSEPYMNGSGNTFIYAAFAEFPFKFSLAR